MEHRGRQCLRQRLGFDLGGRDSGVVVGKNHDLCGVPINRS